MLIFALLTIIFGTGGEVTVDTAWFWCLPLSVFFASAPERGENSYMELRCAKSILVAIVACCFTLLLVILRQLIFCMPRGRTFLYYYKYIASSLFMFSYFNSVRLSLYINKKAT
jgi:hypothetical protein